MSHAFGDIRLGAIRRRSGSELLSPWRPPPLLRTGHAEDANITFQDSGLDRTGRYITDARILTVDRCPLSAVRCPLSAGLNRKESNELQQLLGSLGHTVKRSQVRDRYGSALHDHHVARPGGYKAIASLLLPSSISPVLMVMNRAAPVTRS